MSDAIVLRLVGHPAGWHCYVWRTSTAKGTTRRRQVQAVWLDHADPAESPPDLLRRLAAVLELPLLDRPMPPS